MEYNFELYINLKSFLFEEYTRRIQNIEEENNNKDSKRFSALWRLGGALFSSKKQHNTFHLQSLY